MPMRVAMLSAECEPWAKTGGLADVVDALARALGRLSGEAVETPVDVFLPRYRIVPEPVAIERTQVLSVSDPVSETGVTEVTILDVPADGYRLRLVDHPAAFDRDGFYGDASGDFPDNAWRFGLFCRAALLLTLHNLAYHGWTPRADLGQLGLEPGDGVIDKDAYGIDLLAAGIERAELVNTVSPGFAKEALTAEFGM